MDKYANYKYYKGEKENPYSSFDGNGVRWSIEKYTFDNKEKDYLSIIVLLL